MCIRIRRSFRWASPTWALWLSRRGTKSTSSTAKQKNSRTTLFGRRISQLKPDVVGVTSTTLLYKSAMQLINIAKEIHPQAVTMLGGSHGTFWDENALKEYPSLDMVVRREGEITFIELLDKLQSGGSLCRRARSHFPSKRRHNRAHRRQAFHGGFGFAAFSRASSAPA